MKILVTGYKGFIGSNLTSSLMQDGHNVFGHEWGYPFPNVRDMDQVIHLGAISSTTETNIRKILDQNIDFSIELFEQCIEHGVNFQFASSASVYGNSLVFKEDEPENPLNHYARSKYLMEKYILSRNAPIVAQAFRYFNVYGPREPLRGVYAPVVGIFKRQRDSGEKLTIVGDGTQRRDFTYVKDIVNANLLAAKSNIVHDVFNIGTGVNHSINDVAKLVGGETTYIKPRPAEAKETLANISKANKLLGYEPKFMLGEMINSY